MRLRQYSPTLSSFFTPPRLEVVGQAVGFLLELGIGQLVVATDQGDAVRHSIDSVLSEIGDVKSHGYLN